MNYPFARLCAELWDTFYREIVSTAERQVIDMNRLDGLVIKLFSSPEVILKWVQISDPDDEDAMNFDLTISSIQSGLYYAALLRLPETIRQLLKDGHDPNEGLVDNGVSSFRTPLTAACFKGPVESVSLLLEHGAEPTLFDASHPGCAIVAAIQGNHAEIVKLLLQAGNIDLNGRRMPVEDSNTSADTNKSPFKDLSKDKSYGNRSRDIKSSVDVKLNNTMSIVYEAVSYASLEILDLILKAGANPNIPGGKLPTTIGIPYTCQNLKFREKVSFNGADAIIRGVSSLTPLQVACGQGNLPVILRLIEAGVDVNATSIYRHETHPIEPYPREIYPSPLWIAAEEGDADIVDVLLAHGAKLYEFDDSCGDPLRVASEKGNLAVVEKLVLAGFDVDHPGGRFGTALYAACFWRQLDVARFLLEHHADPNITIRESLDSVSSALRTACTRDKSEESHLDLAALLLDNGADPNLCNPLHLAFALRDTEAISLLVERGAAMNLKTPELETILMTAVRSDDAAMVRLAIEYGSVINETAHPLIDASRSDTCPISSLSLLLQCGADPNLERPTDCHDILARTALQGTGSLSKAKLLLEHGAQVNTIAGPLGSALHHAVRWGSRPDDMIGLLLQYGADIETIIEGWGTPLCTALKSKQISKARTLIEAGANVKSVDAQRNSALRWYVLACADADPGHYLFSDLIGMGLNPRGLDLRGCNCLHYAAHQIMRTLHEDL